MCYDRQRSSLPYSSETISITELGKKIDDFRIRECPLDLRNQRVIKADAERTRIAQLKEIWRKPTGELTLVDDIS